nr:putative retrotransposon Gag domain-containing protein [Tanacetum cinerariifolium]
RKEGEISIIFLERENRSRGIDVRVVAETVARDEVGTDTRDIVKGGDDRVTHPVVSEDVQEAAHEERAVEGMHETLGSLREQGHRIVGVESAVTNLTKRIVELERDNKRLRGTASVEVISRHPKILPSVTLLCCRNMPNTRSGASMTHEEVEELVSRQVAEEMETRKAATNLEPLNKSGDEQEGENEGNGNGGNGENRNENGGNENRRNRESGNENRRNRNGGNGENGNGNGNGGRKNRTRNHGMNYGGFMPVARERTFQEFLKCRPYNFSGTKSVVEVTRWFEKIEIVFNIRNYPSKYQVKYDTCILQDSALTWWNSHKRTIGDECIFVGYSTQSRAYRVFNKRTRVIMESIHVNFEELPQMASDQISFDPVPECQNMALNHDSLNPAIQRQENVTQAVRTVTTSNELDLLFSPMFDELLNGSSKVVSKSSAVSAADAPNQRQQYTTPLNNHTTPAPTC